MINSGENEFISYGYQKSSVHISEKSYFVTNTTVRANYRIIRGTIFGTSNYRIRYDTVPYLVQVYWIRYIKNHNASDRLKFKFLTANLQREMYNFLLQVLIDQNIILHTQNYITECKTMHYSFN